MSSSESRHTIVPVYLLFAATKDEEDRITTALISEDEKDLGFVRPRLIPWTGNRDGDMKDMYRLVKDLRKSIDGTYEQVCEFFFFLGRECLGEKSVILVQPDPCTLMFSEQTMNEMNALLKEHGSTIPEWDENLSGLVETELLQRALTYGRIAAGNFRSTWANLDIANMDMCELVEMDGGVVETIRDENWDQDEFLAKAEEVYRNRSEAENKEVL